MNCPRASRSRGHTLITVGGMFNRYVDGLATWCPEAREDYVAAGQMLAQKSYAR